MAPSTRKRNPMSAMRSAEAEEKASEDAPFLRSPPQVLRVVENASVSSTKPETTTCSCRLFRRVWIVHFSLTISVIFAGVWSNHGTRKYVPIIPEKVGPRCRNAFANVLAPSESYQDAIVCCDSAHAYQLPALCPSSNTMKLPFAGRLARFPDAWLLPLFPLLVRIFYMGYQSVSTAGRVPIRSWLIPVFRRLCLYVLMMNFRGWVLYVGFNRLEDQVVTPVADSCWHRDLLRQGQPECHGRVFDFSDHVVLYFGQLLPIALAEIMLAFDQPYWVKQQPLRHNPSRRYSAYAHVLPLFLIVGLLYLYVITYLGAYKTASWFHTGPEVFAGFLVSLVNQVPLWCLQCHERLAGAREFFFVGSPSKRSRTFSYS